MTHIQIGDTVHVVRGWGAKNFLAGLTGKVTGTHEHPEHGHLIGVDLIGSDGLPLGVAYFKPDQLAVGKKAAPAPEQPALL